MLSVKGDCLLKLFKKSLGTRPPIVTNIIALNYNPRELDIERGVRYGTRKRNGCSWIIGNNSHLLLDEGYATLKRGKKRVNLAIENFEEIWKRLE